jgi:signal transduction histidine kinase
MVIENLVDNASKYTPDKGKIRVSVKAVGGEAVVIVKDNGVGVAPEDRAKLFEKFSRIPNILSDDVGGSGLGLYWAAKVIALHGGRIEVESDLGKGTTFKVYVPLGQAE